MWNCWEEDVTANGYKRQRHIEDIVSLVLTLRSTFSVFNIMVDTLNLQSKVAIVTGSGRENGIGAGIALALAQNGAWVTVIYVSDSTKHRAENVCNTLREAGGKAIAVQASVDTVNGAQLLVKKTLEGFGTDHIDILGKELTFPDIKIRN